MSEKVLSSSEIVSVQNPVRLSERSEPQPNLALLHSRADFYAQAHPGPKDLLLLVEVVEASADPDREVKIPLYAQAGVPEVWLVDLQGEIVEVYRQPSSHGYGQVRQARRSQRIDLESFPDLELSVDDLLG